MKERTYFVRTVKAVNGRKRHTIYTGEGVSLYGPYSQEPALVRKCDRLEAQGWTRVADPWDHK